MTLIEPGDIVTLKGLKNSKEKPLGILKRKWSRNSYEIIWLNEKISLRFALDNYVDPNKLEVVSRASQ